MVVGNPVAARVDLPLSTQPQRQASVHVLLFSGETEEWESTTPQLKVQTAWDRVLGLPLHALLCAVSLSHA